jgi:hypothetical protein
MPISLPNAWADDGSIRRNKFRVGDRLRFIADFYMSDDLANQSATVNFDFTHIDWRNNQIYHNYYSPRFNPGDGGWWYVSWDFGNNRWEVALNWFQVIAGVRGLDELVRSPEGFIQIISQIFS